MSKLDDILTTLENEVSLDTAKRIQLHTTGKSPKQSHYEGKQQIKALMLELISGIDENGKEAERTLAKLVQKVEEL